MFDRFEASSPSNTLTLWEVSVVESWVHLIPGLFLCTFMALSASQAEVAHSESPAKKKQLGFHTFGCAMQIPPKSPHIHFSCLHCI